MRVRSGLLMAVLSALVGAVPVNQPQMVTVMLEGLRSGKGQILVCVARAPQYFPDCTKDPDRRHFAVPARAGAVTLGGLTPGNYAIAIVHDENGNGRLDTFAGIPREGVGFSGNPVLRFGAPSFRSARFAISGSPVEQDIRLKYFL